VALPSIDGGNEGVGWGDGEGEDAEEEDIVGLVTRERWIAASIGTKTKDPKSQRLSREELASVADHLGTVYQMFMHEFYKDFPLAARQLDVGDGNP
jgi:hypothetical protein